MDQFFLSKRLGTVDCSIFKCPISISFGNFPKLVFLVLLSFGSEEINVKFIIIAHEKLCSDVYKRYLSGRCV